MFFVTSRDFCGHHIFLIEAMPRYFTPLGAFEGMRPIKRR
jgi:hypothetical protein